MNFALFMSEAIMLTNDHVDSEELAHHGVRYTIADVRAKMLQSGATSGGGYSSLGAFVIDSSSLILRAGTAQLTYCRLLITACE